MRASMTSLINIIERVSRLKGQEWELVYWSQLSLLFVNIRQNEGDKGRKKVGLRLVNKQNIHFGGSYFEYASMKRGVPA